MQTLSEPMPGLSSTPHSHQAPIAASTPIPSPPLHDQSKDIFFGGQPRKDAFHLSNGTAPAVVPWPPILGERNPWPAPPKWLPRCHALIEQVSREVETHFLKAWKFPNEKSKAKFLGAGFSRVTCLYFPLAKNDRIHFACRLLTVLFLIDDILEDKSLVEGQRYNERLMSVSRGDVLPNRDDSAESVLYDLWGNMRRHDHGLAIHVMNATFSFMRAQTDQARLSMKGLGTYLAYREHDVGKALLSALMRFSMELHLSPGDLDSVTPLEQNCARHISVVNDIFSWEKEFRAAKERHCEGAILCSAVSVLMEETGLGVEATKRVLWQMVREWENSHDDLVNQMFTTKNVSENLRRYTKGLEFQMSGNELWSMTTQRYGQVD